MLLTALYALSASANDEFDYTYQGQTLRYELRSNVTCRVTISNTKYSGKVEIPGYVIYNGEKYSVTSIGHYAFEDCTGLTSVSTPNSVTYINGFNGCTRIRTK